MLCFIHAVGHIVYKFQAKVVDGVARISPFMAMYSIMMTKMKISYYCYTKEQTIRDLFQKAIDLTLEQMRQCAIKNIKALSVSQFANDMDTQTARIYEQSDSNIEMPFQEREKIKVAQLIHSINQQLDQLYTFREDEFNKTCMDVAVLKLCILLEMITRSKFTNQKFERNSFQ